jgi:hypothetical protein
MDSHPTRARRKATKYAAQAEALDLLARAQRKVGVAERKVEVAERERDAALLAAKSVGVRSPQLRAVLGGASRATVFRRVAAAREAAA